MTSCEEVLERAAKDGSIDTKDWARLFDTILSRLEQTVHKAFIIPYIPETTAPPADAAHPSSPPKSQPSDPSSTEPRPSQTANKENVPVSSPPPPPSASQPASMPQTSNAAHYSDFVLPGPLLVTWTYIQTTLTKQFSSYPPHTIQRLAELILRPRQHYHFLPAYLNALDRVVSVSSGSSSFPLPSVELGSSFGPGGSVVNGATTTAGLSPNNIIDSDESLGGALLTPIPWLRNGASSGHSSPLRQANGDNNEGPQGVDGDGDATMVASDSNNRGSGAVTQGELLRQEQEASDPPAPVATADARAHAGAPAAMVMDAEDDGHGQLAEGDGSEAPHARGPERIGLEDTGLRPHDTGPGIGHALNMEAAVGRVHAARASTPETHIGEAMVSDAVPDNVQDDNVKIDNDGDVEITDVDGITEEEKRNAGMAGDGTAPDAVDATAR